MTQEGFKRKLTAILSADVVGYSRLMGEDEDTTVQTLTTYRDVISSLIKDHQGRVVDSPGDNILAEFVSVVNSLRCAWDVQQEIKSRNADLPENCRMNFRIGINLGDVIEEGDRIYGDGVNIAARLESLAEEGGICISGTAYDQVKNKLPFRYEYQGEQVVKNIREPIRVYKVLIKKDADELILGKELELPDKPSIAVLPFKNLSGDPGQEFFSDGFTEDIITTLAKIPRMFVISRESSFTFKGKSVNIQVIGRDLGVRYVLEGSIQKFGDRIRITAQLIDATNGHHLWAEKYDRQLKDIFAMKDEITMKIATVLQVKLTEGESANWGPETKSFEAYIKVRQSWEHFRAFTPDDNILSRQKAKEALDLDPNYSSATEMFAWTLLMDGIFGTSKTPEKSIEQAFELAQEVLDRGDSDAGAHFLIGYAYSRKGQFDKAISELEIARDLFPNNAEINAGLGMILNAAGKPEDAINVLKNAMRLSPIPPSWYLENLGGAYRLTGQYKKAVHEYKKAIQLQPDDMFSHLNLALCYVKLGREEDAHAEAAEVLRINPKFSAESYAKHIPLKDEASKKLLIDGMREAGLPG
ncbi:MAG: tetratricopeptide repeat protein [Desulfobacteraceae bacterium]|nr:tetratricopeptide repeat protein [Desulfobacteraceae bacterium]